MDQDTQAVRADIDRARQDLGQTLDALGDKVSPKHVVRRRADGARQAFSNLRERIMGSASELGSSATDRASSAGSSMAQGTSNMISSVGESAAHAADVIGEVPDLARRQAQGNPLAVGLIAFGAGALVAALIPQTRTERQVAPALRETVVEPLKDVAKDAGNELKDELQPRVEGAVQQVKSTAQQAANEVRQDAESTVQDVTAQAQESAEIVKDQAQESAESVRGGDAPREG